MNAYNNQNPPFDDYGHNQAPKSKAAKPAQNFTQVEADEVVNFSSSSQPEYFLENGIEVLKAINAIQDELIQLGGIGKMQSTKPANSGYSNDKSDKFSYNYRGIDDLYNAISPLMVKNKLICTPHIEHLAVNKYLNKYGDIVFKTCLTIRYTFISAIDGSRLQCVFAGEANDNGDKGVSKAASMAQKYLFLQSLSIPTETDHDPDRYTHDSLPADQNVSQPRTNKNNRLASIEFKNEVDEYMRQNNNRLCDVLKRRNIDMNQITHDELSRIHNDFKAFVAKSRQ